MTSTTANNIVTLAEQMICTKGYSSFSFREIAAELGIKSASVHYHFPTKAHLGLAVAKRYRGYYEAGLEQIEQQHPDAQSRLAALIGIYRQEMLNGERMTLCMMLAAEMRQLPVDIREELLAFHQLNTRWLQRVTGRPEVTAIQVFSLLQGAMVGATARNDPTYFDAAVSAITMLAENPSP